MLTRRTLGLGAGALAATAMVDVRLGRGQAESFGTPLPIPPLIDTAKKGNACKMKAARGRHAFLKGKPTLTYGYSAPILGPVLRVRRGDEVEMTVENALDVPTTVHWHGLLVPGEADGGPQQTIKPGHSWSPILKVNQPAATLWYHPHQHHDTGRQIWMGLAGMLIISDDTESRLGLPRAFGIDDLPLILQDRSFGSDGSLDYGPSPLDTVYGARGDTVIVNGAIAPFARVPPGIVRLRLLNAANAQNFELRFRDRRTFFVIASDAGFLAAPVPITRLRISPAERFEVLVDFADRKSVVLETGPDELMSMFRRDFRFKHRRLRTDHAVRAEHIRADHTSNAGSTCRTRQSRSGSRGVAAPVRYHQWDLQVAHAILRAWGHDLSHRNKRKGLRSGAHRR